ncbi:MAG TPA: glycosyltransferase family 4 protein [Lacipirellula sp.]
MSATADSPPSDYATHPAPSVPPDHDDAGASVIFIGALPPPITGMTAMTAVIVEALKRQGPITCYNWSRGKPLKGWRWKLARAWGALKSIGGLLRRGRARGAVLYYPVSSGAGLYYDLAIAATARLLRYRLLLHHHAYSYFDRRDWRAAWLNRLVGVHGGHAVHCALMQQHYLTQYASKAKFLHVPPTIVSQQFQPELAESRSHDDFTIGFLSNLSVAKGIDDVLATFQRLAGGNGRRVRLILAGPCMSAVERDMVDDALARMPGQIDYRGPVYGRDKAQFFADIDAFLFPTRSESWGIVLSEALAAGCPVVTRNRGCTPWIVRDGCGHVIEADADFPTVAVEHIERWRDNPAEFAAARAAAKRRSAALEQEATEQLPAFVRRVRGGLKT